MRYWIATCYISKLPIKITEPVVMIIVRESRYRHDYGPRTCSPTDLYVPFGYPVYGKYNDYGGIEEIENAVEVISYFRSMDIEPSFADISEENLERKLSDIVCGNCSCNGLRLEAFLVKRDLYELLIKNAASRRIYHKDETLGHQMERLIKFSINEVREQHTYFKKMDIPFRTRSSTYLNDFRLQLCEDDDDITMFLKGKLIENPRDEIVAKLVEIILFYNVLMYLRMGYFAISGDGSQSEERYMHTLVAKYVLDQADKAYEEYLQVNTDLAPEELDDKISFLSEPNFGYYERKSE